MKKISTVALLAVLALGSRAADCNVAVGAIALNGENVPEATVTQLQSRIESLIGQGGYLSFSDASSFKVVASMSDVAVNELPGPPRQTAVQASLVLYLCDMASETVVSTCRIDGLKGVGNSAQQAFSKALRSLNANNPICRNFFNNTSTAIVNYYDKEYPNLIDRAKTLAARQDYEAALYWLFSLPECCKGYDEAATLGLRYYQDYADGQRAFEAARALWVASPDAEGASRALPVLLTIPQKSSAFHSAEALVKEIYATVKDDKKFETRTKYEDAHRLETLKIEAAREVGVAWGRGQQPSTTNLNWIK